MKKISRLLLVVDVQEGFVVDESTLAIIGPINRLIEKWQKSKEPVIFSRFINSPDSPWVKFMGWENLMKSPEINLHSKLKNDYGEVQDKTAYSAWTDKVVSLCETDKIAEVVLCGIDTDQCVLATAIDIFDAGLRPIILKDCCASSATPEFHNAGIMLLERLIGKDQVINSSALLKR